MHTSHADASAAEVRRTLIRGYTKPLYILPFDHRASFESAMFGWTGTLGAEQIARITAAKRVIYEGFCAAIAAGVPKEKAGILVDEGFGSDILREARASGVVTCLPAEKSGQEEFEFEFGEEFARHIEKFAPTFCKVLVRYNTEGDAAMNSRQAARLRRLSEYLEHSPFKFMFELLVPATRKQLHDVRADPRAYDQELRPALMVSAIRELQDFGVEPDVWKVEGLDRREDYESIAAMATRDGRDNVRGIVLGRAEEEQHVREWLATAAAVRGFTGFAVGRTTFWDPLIALRDETITRSAAVAEIARRFRLWVDVFGQTRSATSRSDISHPVPQSWASPAHMEPQREGRTS